MSKHSKQTHERIAPEQVTYVDSFEPDYGSTCENCGETPTVVGLKDGKVVYASGMCGVCTWGESACLDPANW